MLSVYASQPLPRYLNKKAKVTKEAVIGEAHVSICDTPDIGISEAAIFDRGMTRRIVRAQTYSCRSPDSVSVLGGLVRVVKKH